MRWQRVAQAAIAVFVIGFIAVLVTTLRRESAQPATPPPPPVQEEPTAVTQNLGGCEQITAVAGKRVFSLKCGKHFMYADGRQRLLDGVELSLPRDNRDFVVVSNEAEVKPKDAGVDTAVFKGDVRLTSAGLEVRAAEATYADAEGLVTIPGPVEFTRGRMRGAGVGATYDRTRDVLWILQQARVEVDADPKTGEGAISGSADAIGLAKADHFLRLQRNGRLSGEGRVVEADDLVIRLTDDDQRVRAMELRGNSRITGGTGGPQSMSAQDIDLAYAEDGRTLQQARLVENAVLQLPATAGNASKRISARTIDLALGPDGTSVTTLAANERVQVDIPAEGGAPAKRIQSASLAANGPPGVGLQAATFAGGVEYHETRAARAKVAAVDRRATSDSLVLETSPGLGTIQKADFRGNVTFTDAPDFSAFAPQGIYYMDRDRLELSPGDGLPGPPPRVTDGRLSVSARTIDLTVSTRELVAETRVRSTMIPQKGEASGQGRRLPSMLDDDKEINVTANRLKYSGAASSATYTGNAVLWQGDTSLKGDTIIVDDRHGNLTVTGGVTTVFMVDEADRQTGVRKPVRTIGTSETFTYDDKQRLATYTTKARIVGAQGDVTGDKIELFMKADVNELERAEAAMPADMVGMAAIRLKNYN